MPLLANLIPFRKSLEKDLRYAGYEEVPVQKMSRRIFTLSFAAGLAAFLFAAATSAGLLSVLVLIGATYTVQGVIHLMIVFKGEKRAAAVDSILPDALQLISANVRSGMTIDRAIWLSARPEFGPLEEEIKRVSTEVLGSASITDALSRMTERIKSKSLERAVTLINEGLRGGGEMAKLLDSVSYDIRNFQTMVDEVRATTTTYTMFIIMAAVIGAPLLFGISSYFVEIVHNIFATRVLPQAGTGTIGAISITGPQVDPSQIRTFMLSALLTITLFASILVGLIKTGAEKNGLRYAPLMVGIALAMFFIVRAVVSGLFGSILVL